MPKIHNIHIRRETDPQSSPSSSQPPRPRSAQSTATICSETSVDWEVQNILTAANKQRSSKMKNEENFLDFEPSINKVKRSQTFNNRKNLDIHVNKGFSEKNAAITRSHSIARSSAERSLDEMSLYDQMCIQKNSKKSKNRKDPQVEEYRNLVLAEIKSHVSRSLSESDLSDGLGAGASEDTDTGDKIKRENDAQTRSTRSRSSPGEAGVNRGTPSSGYSELTSSSGMLACIESAAQARAANGIFSATTSTISGHHSQISFQTLISS